MDLDFSEYFKEHAAPTGRAEEPGLRPQFFMKPVENPRLSREAGRPIYEEKEYVELVFVGDKSTQVVEKVNQTHRDRWPTAYAQFKAGQEQAAVGTPLEQWPALNRAQVAEFKALKIVTVEELAGLTDAGIARIGLGGREMVNKAKAFLASAAGNAPLTRLEGENEQLRAQLAAQQSQMADLIARVDRLTAEKAAARIVEDGGEPFVDDDAMPTAGSAAEPRRGPGRPRKSF